MTRMQNADPIVRVSFVCTGNICRSPIAEVVFSSMLADAGLADAVAVRSGGTSGWHAGDATDARALRALAAAGYDATGVIAQQLDAGWLDDDLVVAMDRSNVKALRALATTDAQRDHVRLLTSFDAARAAKPDIDDPYFGAEAAFSRTVSQVETACRALVDHVDAMVRNRDAA